MSWRCKASGPSGEPDSLQINVTAMDYNVDFLGEIIDLADEHRTSIMLMYQLVPVGRGECIEEASLDLEQNERLIGFLREKQRNARTIIEPVAGPQVLAVPSGGRRDQAAVDHAAC